jgi:hypothetical protein
MAHFIQDPGPVGVLSNSRKKKSGITELMGVESYIQGSAAQKLRSVVEQIPKHLSDANNLHVLQPPRSYTDSKAKCSLASAIVRLKSR